MEEGDTNAPRERDFEEFISDYDDDDLDNMLEDDYAEVEDF